LSRPPQNNRPDKKIFYPRVHPPTRPDQERQEKAAHFFIFTIEIKQTSIPEKNILNAAAQNSRHTPDKTHHKSQKTPLFSRFKDKSI
jgi:hypothetical protein